MEKEVGPVVLMKGFYWKGDRKFIYYFIEEMTIDVFSSSFFLSVACDIARHGKWKGLFPLVGEVHDGCISGTKY